MSCSNFVINGLKFDECESNLAGVKNVYLTDASDISVTADVTGLTISAISGATFYHYGMDEQVGYLTTTSSVGDNGKLRYYTNEIRIAFPRLSAEKHVEFMALTHNKVKALVEDNNGVWHYVSYDQYLRANDGATAQTGQSFDDDNQYEVILSGRSGYPPFIVDEAAAKAVIEEPVVGS